MVQALLMLSSSFETGVRRHEECVAFIRDDHLLRNVSSLVGLVDADNSVWPPARGRLMVQISLDSFTESTLNACHFRVFMADVN